MKVPLLMEGELKVTALYKGGPKLVRTRSQSVEKRAVAERSQEPGYVRVANLADLAERVKKPAQKSKPARWLLPLRQRPRRRTPQRP